MATILFLPYGGLKHHDASQRFRQTSLSRLFLSVCLSHSPGLGPVCAVEDLWNWDFCTRGNAAVAIKGEWRLFAAPHRPKQSIVTCVCESSHRKLKSHNCLLVRERSTGHRTGFLTVIYICCACFVHVIQAKTFNELHHRLPVDAQGFFFLVQVWLLWQ